MKHASDALWQLRQSNPGPDDMFWAAASDSLGRAAFEQIVASTPAPLRELDRGRAMRARTGRRLIARFAVPAAGAAAAAATALAVGLSSAGTPGQVSYTLDAFLTVRPQAHPADAAAVLRQLAARAAAQPARALGPVEYSSNRKWGYSGGGAPRSLGYFSRHSYTDRAWDAVSGASAVRVVRDFDGKVFTSSYAATKISREEGASINPAGLPASPSALRRHLLNPPGLPDKVSWYAIYTQRQKGSQSRYPQVETGEYPSRSALLQELRQAERAAHGSITHVRILKAGRFGSLSWQTIFVASAIRFLSGEPLPPAVHSSMLRVLAQIAARPGRGYAYVDLGTATDHLGRTGVVIGQEEADDAGPHRRSAEPDLRPPHRRAP